MNPAKFESVLGGAGAERVDVGHVEHQLGDGLAALASASQGVKHDVAANPAGAFQFDDSIARFPVDSETEVEDIEPRDGLDVAHVEQNSTKDGVRCVRKAPLEDTGPFRETHFDPSVQRKAIMVGHRPSS